TFMKGPPYSFQTIRRNRQGHNLASQGHLTEQREIRAGQEDTACLETTRNAHWVQQSLCIEPHHP
ncbi:MAG: hypothetical protein DMG41_19140, partial [Acidobacteria bacterium]